MRKPAIRRAARCGATFAVRGRWGSVGSPSTIRLRHTITRLTVHLVWATGGRVPWLKPEVDPWLAERITAMCDAIGCRAIAVGNASDHVHVLVAYPPTVAVSYLAHRLKGATSRVLAQLLPGGFGWQAGYFAASVDDVEGVAAYVRSQRTHHETTKVPEEWETD